MTLTAASGAAHRGPFAVPPDDGAGDSTRLRPGAATGEPSGVARWTSHDLREVLDRLTHLDPDVDDAERLAQVEALESIKGAAAAAQAAVARDFDASQREAQAVAGVPASRRGRGVGEQYGLARRESPARGARLLGLARVLPELPHTQAALAAGEITEWKATLVARATATLSLDDRLGVDAELAGRLGALSNREVEAGARAIAYRRDPAAFVDLARRAEAGRYVNVRPAPDLMAYVTAYLPMPQAVAIEAALRAAVPLTRVHDGGADRTDHQIRADVFFSRLTGRDDAHDIPWEVGLVVGEGTLLGGDDEPAEVPGFGPVPAPAVRRILRQAGGHDGFPPADDDAHVTLRRLFAGTSDGSLVARDSRARLFTGRLRRFVVGRDKSCRTPYCDGRIRDVDHARSVARGGTTSARNAQGLCARCNKAKEAPGWSAEPVDAPGFAHTVETRTPTGRRYRTHAPPLLPGRLPPRARASRADDEADEHTHARSAGWAESC